jgi:hypothetical protein
LPVASPQEILEEIPIEQLGKRQYRRNVQKYEYGTGAKE